ncbi:MAG: gamma-glutamyltransferase family protein [Chloroflexi bacterium]|nr:gamma-glutamyltransferase family protein [Chloroflexota bacterium]
MSYQAVTTYRAPVVATQHLVASAHYIASAIGYRILEQGGNAVDAGVATGIAINTAMPHFTNFSGVAPIIMYLADRDEVITISGLGRWPRGHTLEEHLRRWGPSVPAGMACVVTPAAADAWLTALERYGTMRLEDVLAPSAELAEYGAPVAASFVYTCANKAELWQQWPLNREVLMPHGHLPRLGERFVQKDLARLFRSLIEAERGAQWKGRGGAIRAARDFFYQGEPAETFVRYVQENGGIISMEDLKNFHVRAERPVKATYKDFTLYTCGWWSQGPCLSQILKLLEGFDLKGMGHNSADYLHAVLEAIKLGFSDRHHYVGDPEFVDVPAEELLSDEYAKLRAGLVDMQRAWPEMPPPGDPRHMEARREPWLMPASASTGKPHEGDTAYLAVADRWGNVFGATTSDTASGAPLIPGLGVVATPRGRQSWAQADHPSCLAPWKRPRLTPNPALAFKDGRFFLAFGTPGADVQVQAEVQMFLNIAEFGMNVQEAVEAPRVASYSHPDSFDPHPYFPGLVRAETRISKDALAGLARRGHTVEEWGDLALPAGCLCGIQADYAEGLLWGGADPRRESAVVGR